MAITFDKLIRPAAGTDYRQPTRHRKLGLGIAVLGVALATITLIANFVAGDLLAQGEEASGILAWSFGLTTLAFGTVKFGVAIILVGIVVRLWLRVESVEAALPDLVGANPSTEIRAGEVDTDYGVATVAAGSSNPLPIHRMARTLWAPMLAMGAMAVIAGFFISLGWANTGDTTAAAWTQGLQFLGEAFLLSGVSFLLASILGTLRDGGGRIQEGLGLPVLTLKMPMTAKLFIALMATGLMLGIFQFVAYLALAANGTDVAAGFAWLGPIRELSLGLLLSGIVLALATIGNALGFQLNRLREIVAAGR
ncbi:MAG: hypothetical protein P1T08_07535 [Acidimicrobiia bacterium]|nr:hypothetical protein [Acidimicrobiia bacterium]